jgi:hypothetical protein
VYVGVVLNPLARKNRAVSKERFERIERILGPYGEVVSTSSLDALRPAVERMLPKVTHFVSDGGDGALHWLINEVRAVSGGDASAPEWPAFVPTNGGTIDFVAYKAGLRGGAEQILRALIASVSKDEAPAEVRLDTIRLTGDRADGTGIDHLGFAAALGGIGLRFFDKYYEDPAPSPGTIVRVIVRTVVDYGLDRVPRVRRDRPSWAKHMFRPTPARVTIDGDEVSCSAHAGIHAASFDVNLGGVFRVFPLAKDRGVLHFQAGELTPTEIIAHLPALLSGGRIRSDNMRDTSGQHMHIESLDGELLDPVIDGERFEGFARLDVRRGPEVRIARVRG